MIKNKRTQKQSIIGRKEEDMKTETQLELLSAEALGEAYDRGAKRILANKEILAPLLQMLIPEYEGYSLEEIVGFIDGASIRDDMPLSDIPPSVSVEELRTEMSSLTEKIIHYDLHFKAVNPRLSGEDITVYLHFDLEPQKSYRPRTPEYPIAKRAIYYSVRELSAQLGTVTGQTNYADLEKVYSIWICFEDIPKALQNTVTEYAITKNDLVGRSDESEEDYDLMSAILIRLGGEETDADVIEYLKGVFTNDLATVKKYSTIQWPEELEEETMGMTGFAGLVYRQGEKEGEQKGRQEGMRLERANTIRILYNLGIPEATILEQGFTREECEAVLREDAEEASSPQS